MTASNAAAVQYLKARIVCIRAQPASNASSRKQIDDVIAELQADIRRLSCEQVH